MDATRFDRWTRLLTDAPSRRGLLRGAGAALGLAVIRVPGRADAKRKHKSKAPKPNAFGCLDVGKPCSGKDSKCCSGICKGKNPTKGKRDKRRCVAHNVLGCQAGQDQCAGAGVSCGASPMGLCYRTTGHAGYCGVAGGCLECRTDADCVEHGGFGEDAACVVCPNCPGEIETACFAAAP